MPTLSPPRPLRRSRAAVAPFPVTGRSPVAVPGDLVRGTAWTLVGALTALALALRLLVPRGLWLDEAISVEQAQLGPAGAVQDLAAGDRHPPLHALALWVAMRVLGDGDLAVRVPSIVAGTLVVPVLFALGVALYDRRTGVLAAAFGTLAPLLVWYSQEARDYVFAALAGTVLVLGAALVLRHGRTRDWVVLGLGASLCAWSHWFALVPVAAVALMLLAVLLRRGRAAVRGALLPASVTLLALGVQLVPLGVLALRQVEATGTGGGYGGADTEGEGVTFYTLVANASWALWGFHGPAVIDLLNAAWPLLMLGSLLLVLGRAPSGATKALLWCAFAPVVALGLLGLANPALFEVRYLMAVVPVGLVLLARVVQRAPRRTGQAVAVAGVALTLVVALADQQLNPDNTRRYDVREALAQAQRTMGPGDVLLYEPQELRFVLNRYAPDLDARPLRGPLPSRDQARRVVVLGSLLERPDYREVVDRQVGALEARRERVGRDRLAGVELWSFR